MSKQFEKLNFEIMKSPKPATASQVVLVLNSLQECISYLETNPLWHSSE
ncbi:MAG: hypothetical protein K2I71_05650 [Helicobacter sp.]|nr:hypothetical protein [Helicobacter sp.]